MYISKEKQRVKFDDKTFKEDLSKKKKGRY